jgi:hypothetical protein
MKIFTKFIILSVIFSIILISGCVNNDQKVSESKNSTAYTNASSSVEKVEIIHFHGTNQCNSCIAVGALAEKTVNTYFSEELESGKVTFSHINAELAENRGLVTKYGVNSASLWIGVYDENGFHKEMNANVWYKINNETEYMSYLKGIIEKRLAGDFS